MNTDCTRCLSGALFRSFAAEKWGSLGELDWTDYRDVNSFAVDEYGAVAHVAGGEKSRFFEAFG